MIAQGGKSNNKNGHMEKKRSGGWSDSSISYDTYTYCI